MAEKKTKPSLKPRVAMPEQPAAERVRNFSEVALGYAREQAITEAERCLQCKKPACVKGCPVEIKIPDFIARLAQGDVRGAYGIIRETNSLPAVCGRVCPQESQCEGACILGQMTDKASGQKHEPVAIGRLERFVADTFAAESACDELTGKPVCAMPRDGLKVACIGSGPSSLTVAGYLSALGVQVTIFEALHEPGGVLVYGIPEFRLPKATVGREIDALRGQGVNIRCNWVGGKTVAVRDLLDDGYQAVFIGVGAGLPKFLGVPGESLVGVYSANEYLTRVNLGRAYDYPAYDTPVTRGRHVAVIGGGNVAMDAARTALRLGAERVSIVYRRTLEEMPARREEIHHALEEGMQLEMLCNPTAYVGDGKHRLAALRLQRMCLGAPDASGRCRPEVVPGDVFELPCDQAIIAVGTGSNRVLLQDTPEVTLNKWGYIVVDEETGETSLPGVYAGGDIVTGAATVILAMGAGRRAAKAIARKLGLQ